MRSNKQPPSKRWEVQKRRVFSNPVRCDTWSTWEKKLYKLCGVRVCYWNLEKISKASYIYHDNAKPPHPGAYDLDYHDFVKAKVPQRNEAPQTLSSLARFDQIHSKTQTGADNNETQAKGAQPLYEATAHKSDFRDPENSAPKAFDLNAICQLIVTVSA